MANKQQSKATSTELLQTAIKYQKAGIALNGCLLIFPWAVLFAAGVLV